MRRRCGHCFRAAPTSTLLTLVRYVYWLTVFIVTVWIITVESASFIQRLVVLMALAGVVLGLMRLSEAILFGRWGAWTGPELTSQNNYGIHFSMVAAFVLLLPFVAPRAWRIPSLLAIVSLLAAIAGNGSRSSWVAGGISILVMLALYVLAAFNRAVYRARLAAGSPHRRRAIPVLSARSTSPTKPRRPSHRRIRT